MPLTEYLYVDERRLNSYFEQISSPVEYDKVPVWKAVLSLKGPQAEGTQARFARPFTIHEKVTSLIKFLDKGELGRGRAKSSSVADRRACFRLEKCRARAVFIPMKKDDSPSSSGVKLWISLQNGVSEDIETLNSGGNNRPSGNLYLLEDAKSEDGYPHIFSSYSFLEIILGEEAEQMRNTILVSALEAESSELKSNQQIEKFSTNPFLKLSELGAKIGAERNIEVLYRVRANFMDSESEPRFCAATFGYPIFISSEDNF